MTHHEKHISSEYRALVAEQIDTFCELNDGHNEIVRSGLIYDVWAEGGEVTQIEREGAQPATVGDIKYINTFIDNHKTETAQYWKDVEETEAMLFISER